MMFLQLSLRFLVALTFLPLSRGLHFYLRPGDVKCFYEKLNSGNLMVGDIKGYVQEIDTFVEDPELKFTVSVDEAFDSNYRVMNQNNMDGTGDFTFTALDTGEHRICIKPSYPQDDAVLRIFMDLDISNLQVLDATGKEDLQRLVQRILRMVKRLERIRQDQRMVRKTEALFRDQSESTNSKILCWSLLQVFGLAIMCAIQLRYLKNFFVKQKVI